VCFGDKKNFAIWLKSKNKISACELKDERDVWDFGYNIRGTLSLLVGGNLNLNLKNSKPHKSPRKYSRKKSNISMAKRRRPMALMGLGLY